jgi:hypothetical protein
VLTHGSDRSVCGSGAGAGVKILLGSSFWVYASSGKVGGFFLFKEIATRMIMIFPHLEAARDLLVHRHVGWL